MPVKLAANAMATRFELVLDGGDEARLRAAGEDALEEIARLDGQLSFYRSTSDVSWINGRAAFEPVLVEPRLFELLKRCLALSAATDGAFDITIAPLMKAWRFTGGSGAYPEPAALARARALVGYRGVELDAARRTVRFARPGMLIDLGSAGKGYAVDRAIARLRENGVSSGLLHGGTSSVHAIGSPPRSDAWRIGWTPDDTPARTFELRDSALAVSAVHGKAFRANGRVFGHVMDPHSGVPADVAESALVTGPDSLHCDALSTALLVRGAPWLPTMSERFPGYSGAVA
jgi:thiamine biosynthesis lipoprotein